MPSLLMALGTAYCSRDKTLGDSQGQPRECSKPVPNVRDCATPGVFSGYANTLSEATPTLLHSDGLLMCQYCSLQQASGVLKGFPPVSLKWKSSSEPVSSGDSHPEPGSFCIHLGQPMLDPPLSAQPVHGTTNIKINIT